MTRANATVFWTEATRTNAMSDAGVAWSLSSFSHGWPSPPRSAGSMSAADGCAYFGDPE